jgi:L-alanine-DL-glutamate epimerase-like enolase superfamily enzyme
MGGAEFIQKQVKEKLAQNFKCLKFKIGKNWDEELRILQNLRRKFSAEILEIRVDANGAFSPEKAEKILAQLADLQIHSIEQPIKQGNLDAMSRLCRETPTPIALDEELIGVNKSEEKKKLLEKIRPQFIILKPALAGGFSGSDEWISIAENLEIRWWITSALESNIGLNALAQYAFTKNCNIPQGLGTGALYENNFPASLELMGDLLFFKPQN